MQEQYYVSHDGQQMGPYSVDQIVQLVKDGSLAPLDYVYDEAKADWVLFLEHDLIASRVKETKPKTPPGPKHEDQHKHESNKVHQMPVAKDGQHEWYVLKGDNKFGPFGYHDVVKMLQQGVVFEFDFAWHEGLQGWQRIAEVNEFKEENIRKLKSSSMPEINEVFFRRRHKRVKYGGTIIVHDNQKVWKGKAMEISEGGAGVIMENALIVPGQSLYLHFKPGDGVPPFNAVCEVVSKKYVSDIKDPKAPVKYGLKFKTISTEAQKILHDFTKKDRAAA